MTRLPVLACSRPVHTTARVMAPHPPFPEVQASRPDWREEQQPEVTKTRKPDWKFGQGANSKEGADKKHISFGPYDEGRNPGLNYKVCEVFPYSCLRELESYTFCFPSS